MKKLFSKLIVSAQIRPNEPFSDYSSISKIIDYVSMTEVNCVRVTDEMVAYAKDNGLFTICVKKPNGKIRFINPDETSILKSISVKPDAIAVESSFLLHPEKETLKKLYDLVKQKSQQTYIVADIATYDDALRAYECGADIITTTLSRIKERGGHCKSHKDHVALTKKIIERINIPLFAEGGISSPEEAIEFLKVGCSAVVIGYHIIHPQTITNKYINQIKKYA